MSKLYQLYKPIREWDSREYLITITEGYKIHGYLKLRNEKSAKWQHLPDTSGMRFIGYMKEDKAEEMLFLDLI